MALCMIKVGYIQVYDYSITDESMVDNYLFRLCKQVHIKLDTGMLFLTLNVSIRHLPGTD